MSGEGSTNGRRTPGSPGAAGTRVLVVGESWIKHTVHMKGWDQFESTEYEEGAGVFLGALEAGGLDVTYLRAHEISYRFPRSLDELSRYDVVVVSDVGANSFLLTDDTFLRSKRGPNLLELLCEYVLAGGGLVMVGGYLSFSGIDGRARYGMSPLAKVMPVSMLNFDDRIEKPEGVTAHFTEPGHPALGGTPAEWPALLGYNRVTANPDATVIAWAGADPLLVVGSFGRGRSVAFTSDLAPHWAPPEFLAWPHYGRLWAAVLSWAGAGRLVETAGGRVG